MIRVGLTKFNIDRNNYHLKDIYSSSSHFLELGTINYDVIMRLLNFEMINLDDITYLPIQNCGIGKSDVNNEELKNFLPFLFYENLNQKNKSMQLFISYGLLRLKDENNKEIFSPIVLIPVNIYHENDRFFFQQISRPVENVVLIDFLNEVKKINIVANDKLDNIYAIDKFCMSFEKYDGLHLELESFITFSTLKEKEIKIDHDKFDIPKTYDDYLFDKLYENEIEPIYYLNRLNRFQRYAVHNAFNGNNIVINGRLGTGKTTALANIAINAINQEKRVLYISNMKETLDYIYHLFEEKEMNQFVTNFSNSFASFHQGELIINPKVSNSENEDIETLINNYKFINTYENLMTGRIVDNRFIEIINELAKISDVKKNLLDIDDLSHLYKSEYLETLKALEQIQNLLGKIDNFQNSTWKDIPLINNVKYPNQIFTLIYQVQNGFSSLEEEKKILETEYGFKEITNYALLKNIIHNFKNLNIADVPLSWKDLRAYEAAKEEYRNLKNEIYQLQELEYYINYKYINIPSIDIKKEISYILGDFFTKDDLDKIDKINQDRLNIVVLNDKAFLQIDIFRKSLMKISQLMKWEFNTKNYILEELIRLSNILSEIEFNSHFLDIILNNRFDQVYKQAFECYITIVKLKKEKEDLFKNSPIQEIGDVETTIESVEKFSNNQSIKKSAYKILNNLKENEPNSFTNVMKNIKKSKDIMVEIKYHEEKFFKLLGFNYSFKVLEDLKEFDLYLNSIDDKFIKSKIIKFLIRVSQNSESKASKSYLKVFDLFYKSYMRIIEIYNHLSEYHFTSPSEEFMDKVNDLNRIKNYTQSAFASNDRLRVITKNTNEIFIKAEDYISLDQSLDKIKFLKDTLINNSKYKYLYGNLYNNYQTNINDIAKLLQTYKVYMECFKGIDNLVKSFEVYSTILEHINKCSETSDNLNEIFKIYFKIFKDSVSRYYYDDFESNLDYLEKLLNSKEELIVYLNLTENLKVLFKYNLNKLIDYILNIKEFNNLVIDFKYTYLTTIKNNYIEQYPFLVNYKSLEACLNLAYQEEGKILEDVEATTFKNIRRSSGNRYSVFGIKNLDYNTFIRRTSGIKKLFLSTTQILNNFLNLKNFDLVIIDDAHLLSANEYFLAIQGAQVVVAGEQQLQSAVANNLISRLRSSKNINFDYRYPVTPKSLLTHMEGLKGRIYGDYYDNFGIEVIYDKLLEYISLLFKENNNYVINLFVSSIVKQREYMETLTNIFLEQDYPNDEIIKIFKNNINICDLSVGYLYNADFNIIDLEDYYKVETEYIVVNLIDKLLLCKKKLLIYDSNSYLKIRKGPKFLTELKKVVNNRSVFQKQEFHGLIKLLVDKLEEAKITIYASNLFNFIIKKKSKLFGVVLFWDDNKANYNILNEYRDYLTADEKQIKAIIVWSMELINSIDGVVNRVIEEIDRD